MAGKPGLIRQPGVLSHAMAPEDRINRKVELQGLLVGRIGTTRKRCSIGARQARGNGSRVCDAIVEEQR
jgi:hypothetical protein